MNGLQVGAAVLLRSAAMETMLRTVALLTTIHLLRAAEVRCFCNLPRCVTTGYMCKSAVGGCFSDLGGAGDVLKATHGCLDLLDRSLQNNCQSEHSSQRGHQRSLLVCCNSDMCNHVERPEIKLRVYDSFQGPETRTAEPRGTLLQADYASRAEVWFKAATIAVPICGAVVLYLLVALAVSLLRRDASDAAAAASRAGVGPPKQGRRPRGDGSHAEGASCLKTAPLLRQQHSGKRYLKRHETNSEITDARQSGVSESDKHILITCVPKWDLDGVSSHLPANVHVKPNTYL